MIRSQQIEYRGQVIGKPRQTRSDKWKQRPCVMAYRNFADSLRLAFGRTTKFSECPAAVSITAFLPLPKSWSLAKRIAMESLPHQQKPDVDNIAKAVLDALFQDDSGIAKLSTTKLWDDGAGERMIITLHWQEAQTGRKKAA